MPKEQQRVVHLRATNKKTQGQVSLAGSSYWQTSPRSTKYVNRVTIEGPALFDLSMLGARAPVPKPPPKPPGRGVCPSNLASCQINLQYQPHGTSSLYQMGEITQKTSYRGMDQLQNIS